jgi:hypothetical protein
MARRMALILAGGVAAGWLLVAAGQAPAQADEGTPVVAGTFTGQLKVTDSWQSGGWGVKGGSRALTFGQGCAMDTSCPVTSSASGAQTLEPERGGFGWSGSAPVGCVDNVTGALKTNHGFDYTYRVRFEPAGTTTRDGVTYVTRMRGTYNGRLAVNATGRAFNCLVNPRRVPVETERAVYDLRLAPLAAPKTVTSSPPVATTPPAASASGTMPGFHLPRTDRQDSSAEAVASGTRSSVPGALVTPSEAIRTVGDRLPQDLLLVALLGLLIVFPAQLFDSTYEENHQRIDRQLARLRLRRRHPVVPAQRVDPATEPAAVEDPAPPRGRRIAVFLGVVVAGTLLGGLLDPKLGANTPSYALLLGIFASVLLVVGIGALAGRLFRSASHHPSRWYLAAVPSGLLVAALCVLVSRLTQFEPGYLYGVLGGAVFAVALNRKSEGRLEAAITVTILVVAIGAWIAFDPVSRAADATDASFGLLTLDAFLASLFIGGLEGLMFGLVPLQFLPGSRIRSWSWIAWGALMLVVLYAFVHVLLMPESGYLGRGTAPAVGVSIALFAAFGVASGLFWLYFRLRPDKQAAPAQPAGTGEPAAEPPRSAGAAPVLPMPSPAKVPVETAGGNLAEPPPQVPRQPGAGPTSGPFSGSAS